MDFAAIESAYQTLYIQMFPAISQGAWRQWSAENRQVLNDWVHTLSAFINTTIRQTYDDHVWEGNKLGLFVGNTATGLEPKKPDEVTQDKLLPVRRQKADTATVAVTLTPEEMAMASIKRTKVVEVSDDVSPE